jgi:hypothetical protein
MRYKNVGAVINGTVSLRTSDESSKNKPEMPVKDDTLVTDDKAMATGTIEFSITLDESFVLGSMSDKYGNTLPDPLRFEYHTNPPVDMDVVTKIVYQLEHPGVDVVLMNTDDSLIELIEQCEKLEQTNQPNDQVEMDIVEGLSKTYQGDKVEAKDSVFNTFSTSSSEDVAPASVFHLDDRYSDSSDSHEYYVQLNYWIALKDVKGRPLAFVKYDSTKQKRVLGDDLPQLFDHDLIDDLEPVNELFYIPSMKKGQIVVFKGTELWHGTREST